MPRTRKTPTGYSPEQIAAFAALWATNQNIRRPTPYATAISKLSEPEYVQTLVDTLGGELKPFMAKDDKQWNGWYLTSQQKLDILTQLEEQGKLDWLDIFKRDKYRSALKRDIDS